MAVLNGRIPAALLTSLGFSDAYGRPARLSSDAAASLVRLAARLGVDLGPDDLSDSYRDLDRQVSMFRDRFVTIPIDGYQYSVRWDGQTWYLRPGVSSAAVPGTSDHGLGNAIDARGTLKARMRANLTTTREYGWTFPIRSEDWHALYSPSLDRHHGEDADVLTADDKAWITEQLVGSLDRRVSDQPFRDKGTRSTGFIAGKTLAVADQIRAAVLALTKQVAGLDQVDEAALAAELAPLLTGMVVDLDDANLAAIATAVADEQARRMKG